MANLRSNAFFLEIGTGQRLCIFHPANGKTVRGAILYIHPFAEEMNKSRRMARLQSQAFADRGYAVLQIDLNGCGDSSGDFSIATWRDWHEDISAAWDFLQTRHEAVFLWGLRLGATLALDFSNLHNRWPAGFFLWQPVLSGETFMTQFLRLRVASEMLEGSSGGGVKALRESLKRGEFIEVAGYRLNPALVEQMDAVSVRRILPKNSSVFWLETVSEEGQAASPIAIQTAETWRQTVMEITFDTVFGPSFWATQEITDCPTIIERTMRYIEQLK